MQFILSFAYIQTSPVSIIKLSLKLDTSGIFSRVLLDIQKMLRSEHQFQIWNLKQDPCCTTCKNCFVEYVSPRLTSQTSNSMFFMTSLKHLILAFTRLRVTTRKLQKSLYNYGKVSFHRLGRPWNEISIVFNNCHNSLTFVFFLFFSVPPKINDMNRLRQHAANNWHWHWYNFRSCVRVNG